MKKRKGDMVKILLDKDVYVCLLDQAWHNGHASVKAWLDDFADHMGNGGYHLYIRRRYEWYRTHLEDYIETQEFCDQWFFDFNAFARSKLVKDHKKVKRY